MLLVQFLLLGERWVSREYSAEGLKVNGWIFIAARLLPDRVATAGDAVEQWVAFKYRDQCSSTGSGLTSQDKRRKMLGRGLDTGAYALAWPYHLRGQLGRNEEVGDLKKCVTP